MLWSDVAIVDIVCPRSDSSEIRFGKYGSKLTRELIKACAGWSKDGLGLGSKRDKDSWDSVLGFLCLKTGSGWFWGIVLFENNLMVVMAELMLLTRVLKE